MHPLVHLVTFVKELGGEALDLALFVDEALLHCFSSVDLRLLTLRLLVIPREPECNLTFILQLQSDQLWLPA